MATAERTYKPKSHIILDLECLSLDRHAGIIHIGAVGQFGSAGQTGQFEIKIKPSEYERLTQFRSDADTKAFHERENPGYLDKLELEGMSLAEALAEFQVWAGQFTGEGQYELHVWSQGKDYDFPILDYAFGQVGIQIPWKFRNIHCVRDLLFLNPRSRVGGNTKGAHTALEDAIWAHKQWRKIIADSSWYQRLFN